MFDLWSAKVRVSSTIATFNNILRDDDVLLSRSDGKDFLTAAQRRHFYSIIAQLKILDDDLGKSLR